MRKSKHFKILAANAAVAAMNSTAQTTNKSNNAAILSLLNSSPANLTQQKVQPRRISLNTSIPSRVLSHGNVINVPNTTGQVSEFNLRLCIHEIINEIKENTFVR